MAQLEFVWCRFKQIIRPPRLGSLKRIVTRGIPSAVLFAAGDALAQIVIEKKKFDDMDRRRTLSIAGMGFLYQTVRPIVYSGFSSAVIMALGDLLAQIIIDDKKLKEVNKERLMIFAGLGLFFVGPTLHVWTNFLNRVYPRSAPGLPYKRVLVDQLLFTPPFLYAFLTLAGYASGKSRSDVESDVRSKYKNVMIANYEVWPLTHLLTLFLLPIPYQPLIVNPVAVFWCGYLSMTCNRAAPPPAQPEDDAARKT